MPAKHQPDFIYLRHVPLRKVHLFTIIQLSCLVLLWVIKTSRAAIVFPMMVRHLFTQYVLVPDCILMFCAFSYRCWHWFLSVSCWILSSLSETSAGLMTSCLKARRKNWKMRSKRYHRPVTRANCGDPIGGQWPITAVANHCRQCFKRAVEQCVSPFAFRRISVFWWRMKELFKCPLKGITSKWVMQA